MKKRMIKLMTIFCMAGILTVNPVITGLAEGAGAVGADASEDAEPEEELAEEEAEEPETDAEESDEETEEEPETETVESEEDSVENNQVVTTSTKENVPVVMANNPDSVSYVEINKNDNDENPAKDVHMNSSVYKEGTSITLTNPDNKRSGYDFGGWYKDGSLLSGSTADSYNYIITKEDVDNGKIILIAGWRQQVSLSVDGGEATPLEAGKDAAAEQATYNLTTVMAQLTKPSESYEFANKWVVNGEGPYTATDNMTVMFAQTDGNLVFDAVNVKVDGQTNVSTDHTIELTSCWNPTNGYSDFRITNNTSDRTLNITASNNHEANLYNGTAYIDTVPDNDKLTFKANGWTLKKSVNELKAIASQPIYVNKSAGDVRYYQCRELTIKDSDFEKTINITYQDKYQDTNTRFLRGGEVVGNTVSMSNTIHAGLDELWEEYLKTDITAERGEYLFDRWKFLWNGKEYSENEIKKETIDFYKDNTHSLTVQPVWNGSYTCDANYPTNQGSGTKPETKIAEVGTTITLPILVGKDGQYTFEGWLGSDGNTYPGGASYIIENANVTFTGQWKAVSHNLKFMDENGIVYSEGKADFNTKITWPSEPTKEGYTFQNWVVEIDNAEMSVEHGHNFIMPDQDITFIAQWSINSYKISYDGNGAAMGVPAETAEKNYQEDYTIDTVIPTKTGYTFQGWSDRTTTYQPGATFKVPAKDVVLTAQWKVNSHQVKYDGNGGKTSAPASKSADYNSNVSVAAGLEKDGYVFEGWEQISTGKILAPGASFVMPDMDETLKAKWKIAHTSINGKGTYYLVSGQSYTLGSGLKVQGDNSSYSGNMTFYVPQSGYYTFE